MAGSIATYPDSFAPEPRAAFLSDDAADILAFAAECLEGGHKAALVTLVEIRGGAARALGAQMVVREDGFIAASCLAAARKRPLRLRP